jgi:hypothetical protein
LSLTLFQKNPAPMTFNWDEIPMCNAVLQPGCHIFEMG